MPTDITQSTQQVQRISNSLDNMTSASIGPDQANCKVNSLSYILFDYNGTQAADPVVSVRALCSPTDGSNDNKDFEIDWTTGAKTKDFAIILDGGALSPVGSRMSLNNNSNWALFQRSLKDAGYDVNLFDGDAGIRIFDGAEIVVRKVPQPKREGLSEKNEKGYDKNYYTCLKLISLPGEAKKPGAKKTTAPTAVKSTSSSAPTQAKASTNGHSSSEDVMGAIEAVVKDSAGSIDLQSLKMSLFRHFKDAGKPVAECQKLATESATEDYIVMQAMEKGLSNWNIENGTLTIV